MPRCLSVWSLPFLSRPADSSCSSADSSCSSADSSCSSARQPWCCRWCCGGVTAVLHSPSTQAKRHGQERDAVQPQQPRGDRQHRGGRHGLARRATPALRLQGWQIRPDQPLPCPWRELAVRTQPAAVRQKRRHCFWTILPVDFLYPPTARRVLWLVAIVLYLVHIPERAYNELIGV